MHSHFLERERTIVLACILFKLALHYTTLERYGYHHDDLLSLAASHRVQLGYLAGPGFYHWFLALNRFLFGDSILAIRWVCPWLSVLPLYALYLIHLALKTIYPPHTDSSRVLTLALCATVFAPTFLGLSTYYNEHLFDHVIWAFSILYAVRYVLFLRSKDFYYFAIWIATGLLVRPTSICFAIFVFAYLWATKKIHSIKILVVLMLASLSALPTLIWQRQNGWPFLMLLSNRAHTRVFLTVIESLKKQLCVLNPSGVPLFFLGIGMLFSNSLRRIQGVSWALFLNLLVLLLLQRSPYNVHYMAPTVIVTGALMVTLSVPVLPLDILEKLSTRLAQPFNSNIGRIPPHLPMMLDWKETVSDLERIEQTFANKRPYVILSDNIGIAGAMEFFGHSNPKTPVLCNRHEYWIWGRNALQFLPAERALVVGFAHNEVSALFHDIRRVGTHSCPRCRWREEVPIFWCEHPRAPLTGIWPALFR